MMLTGINAQSANRYGVAVILCPTGLLFELFLFHCNQVIFTLTIFKTILNSQGSELNYLYSVLSAFLVQTGTQICRATQPHLVVIFPSRFQSALQTHQQLSTVFTPLTFQVLVIHILTPPRTIWQPVYPQMPRQALSCILMHATHAQELMPVKCQAGT